MRKPGTSEGRITAKGGRHVPCLPKSAKREGEHFTTWKTVFPCLAGAGAGPGGEALDGAGLRG